MAEHIVKHRKIKAGIVVGVCLALALVLRNLGVDVPLEYIVAAVVTGLGISGLIAWEDIGQAKARVGVLTTDFDALIGEAKEVYGRLDEVANEIALMAADKEEAKEE